MVHYTIKPANQEKSASARADNVKAHFKNTYELTRALRGMKVSRAQAYLNNVIRRKEIVPMRKHHGHIGRKAQCKGLHCSVGRWPAKSAKYVLELLKNAINNAKTKGLNTDEMYVSHIATKQARGGRRRLYRAHGSINSFCSNPCHVELILVEKEKKVAKPTEGAKVHKISQKKMFARMHF